MNDSVHAWRARLACITIAAALAALPTASEPVQPVPAASLMSLIEGCVSTVHKDDFSSFADAWTDAATTDTELGMTTFQAQTPEGLVRVDFGHVTLIQPPAPLCQIASFVTDEHGPQEIVLWGEAAPIMRRWSEAEAEEPRSIETTDPRNPGHAHMICGRASATVMIAEPTIRGLQVLPVPDPDAPQPYRPERVEDLEFRFRAFVIDDRHATACLERGR